MNPYLNKLFAIELVDRAHCILKDGLLLSFETLSAGHFLGLFVGSDTIEAEVISVDHFQTLELYCSCQVFHLKKQCPHVIATLILASDLAEQSKTSTTPQSAQRQLLGLLEDVDPPKLHRFLRKFARSDKRFEEAIKLFLIENSDHIDEVIQFDQLVKSLIRNKRNRSGVVPPKSANIILNQIHELVDKAFEKYKSGNISEAFGLANALVSNAEPFFLEDDQNYSRCILDFLRLKNLIITIKANCLSPELKERIVSWIREYQQHASFDLSPSNLLFIDDSQSYKSKALGKGEFGMASLLSDGYSVLNFEYQMLYKYLVFGFLNKDADGLHLIGKILANKSSKEIEPQIDLLISLNEEVIENGLNLPFLDGLFANNMNTGDKLELILKKRKNTELKHLLQESIIPNLNLSEIGLPLVIKVVDKYLDRDSIFALWKTNGNTENVHHFLTVKVCDEDLIKQFNLNQIFVEDLSMHFGKAPIDRLIKVLDIAQFRGWSIWIQHFTEYLRAKVPGKAKVIAILDNYQFVTS